MGRQKAVGSRQERLKGGNSEANKVTLPPEPRSGLLFLAVGEPHGKTNAVELWQRTAACRLPHVRARFSIRAIRLQTGLNHVHRNSELRFTLPDRLREEIKTKLSIDISKPS